MSRSDFLKIASKYHLGLVAKYIRLNKLEIAKLKEIMPQNEEIYKILLFDTTKIYSQEEKNIIYASSSNWVKGGKSKKIHFLKIQKLKKEKILAIRIYRMYWWF